MKKQRKTEHKYKIYEKKKKKKSSSNNNNNNKPNIKQQAFQHRQRQTETNTIQSKA